jgi:hypothetical protein
MFSLALALRTRVDPWLATAIAAGAAIPLAVWALGRATLARLLHATARDIGLALALGVALVVATHAAYLVLPSAIRHEIDVLYGSIAGTIPTPVLAAITAMVVVAEELIWRGVALELGTPRATAPLVAVALYVVPQLGGSAWLLVLAALGLGSLFTWQRTATGSLVSPLVTHAIWSISIFVLVPLR